MWRRAESQLFDLYLKNILIVLFLFYIDIAK